MKIILNFLHISRQITAIYLLSVLSVLIVNLHAQDFKIPDDPLKGRIVMEKKGCLTCHAIQGNGGDLGPDLGEENFFGNFFDLSSILWNHSPEMMRQMRELDLPYPNLTEEEMNDLVAYLYYLRYLGAPGNLFRGKLLVKEKGCLYCHNVRKKTNKRSKAPAFDNLSNYASPLFMAQSLWNHGPQMYLELKKKGIKTPIFKAGEIGDLSAYIREASKNARSGMYFMSPGNPKNGEMLFSKMNCIQCHYSDSEKEGIGPDIEDMDLNHSVTEIAGMMWNHGLEMSLEMKKKNIAWPKFVGNEMADLISYLYFFNFKTQPGSAENGKSVFVKKGCQSCHGGEGKKSKYPNKLFNSGAKMSPLSLVRFMWNHAPVMEEKSFSSGMPWPELSGKEIADLLAYLQSIDKDKID